MFIHTITVWLATRVRGVGAKVVGASRAQVILLFADGTFIKNMMHGREYCT